MCLKWSQKPEQAPYCPEQLTAGLQIVHIEYHKQRPKLNFQLRTKKH